MRFFLFSIASGPALGPAPPPIQLVKGVLTPGIKRDHPPPYSVEVKNGWSYTSTPLYVFKAWCLVKHRGIFTFFIFTVRKSEITLLLSSRGLLGRDAV
jgi:hypothetical protein